jgi:tetratricopeptide (TPR) repeat protein
MRRLIRRITRWFKSRPTSLLLPALPALIVCMIWVVFAAFIMGWGSAHTEMRYRQAAGMAVAGRDYETARVAYWRLAQLKSEKRNEYLFGWAMSLLGTGRNREAEGVLTVLAPLDGPGYSQAHLFVAKSLLSSTNAAASLARLAEAHLLRALRDEPSMIEASSLLGRLYMRMGLWDSAQKHLRETVAARPEDALLLAYVLRAKGEDDEARGWAERAAKHFASKVSDPKEADDPGSRIAWANAMVMLKDYPAALSILEAGLQQSGDIVYRPALGALYGNWVQSAVKDAPLDFETRFKLVQSGLQYSAANEFLLQELVSLTRLEGAQSQPAMDAVKKMLAEGGAASAILHYFLGIDAWQQGRKDEAQGHFSIAFDMAPFMPTVANNLAMILTVGDKPDYERALKVIDPIVQKLPQDAQFRSTRGLVLLKLGRYEESVADLQASLPRLNSKRSSRLALAEAYRHLNMKDLADEQERLANQGEVRPNEAAPTVPAPVKPAN